jgi:hypothetical protein
VRVRAHVRVCGCKQSPSPSVQSNGPSQYYACIAARSPRAAHERPASSHPGTLSPVSDTARRPLLLVECLLHDRSTLCGASQRAACLACLQCTRKCDIRPAGAAGSRGIYGVFVHTTCQLSHSQSLDSPMRNRVGAPSCTHPLAHTRSHTPARTHPLAHTLARTHPLARTHSHTHRRKVRAARRPQRPRPTTSSVSDQKQHRCVCAHARAHVRVCVCVCVRVRVRVRVCLSVCVRVCL